jgi:hypothetical protein
MHMGQVRAAMLAMGAASVSVEVSAPHMHATADWQEPPDYRDDETWIWDGSGTDAATGSISLTAQPWLGALDVALALASVTALVVAATRAYRGRARVTRDIVALIVVWAVLAAQLIEFGNSGSTHLGDLAAAGIVSAAQFHLLTMLNKLTYVLPVVAPISVAVAGWRFRRKAPLFDGTPSI